MTLMNMYTNQRCIIFDESRNLGSKGRYFVIACIDTTNYKALHNIMHRKLGIAKKKFSELAKLHSHEIKAQEAYPCIKYHILECIITCQIRTFMVLFLYNLNKIMLDGCVSLL